MRQTLFYIPHEIYGLPLFGFGWLLIVWALASAVLLAVMLRKYGWSEETKSFIPLLAVVGLVVVFILPVLEEGSHGGPFAQLRGLVAGESVDPTLPPPRGLPIRGYGVMMLMGVLAGVGLAAQRARRMGLNPEVIYSLAFFMFLGGIAGARGFYVVQKWDEFRSDSLMTTVGNILKFTEGGLVVYGSLIGGLLAAVWFCSRKRLPMLAIGDLIAPSLVVGLAFGRIGCLMNGCCWGGPCDTPWLGVTFPPSPPYMQQLTDGQLLGLTLGKPHEDGSRTIEAVAATGPAAESGLRPGDRVTAIRPAAPDQLRRALAAGDDPRPAVQVATSRGTIAWHGDDLPARSRPVHPTQIYGSLNGALLAFLLWFYYPFRRRDGEVLALLLTLYPITRFLMEMVRVDEAGVLGTTLSISQVVSLALFAAAMLMWGYLFSRPRGVAFPVKPAT